MIRSTRLLAAGAVAALVLFGASPFALGEPMHSITIDGAFGDWASVPLYSDGIDDTHDTEPRLLGEVPIYVNHPDVDLVEYKFTHDANNLYAYFRATGEIGRTATGSQKGRYYVIVTIDVDNDNATGYELCEGGYYPTSNGYDMNMEVEFYNGAFNTGHYINHGALDEAGKAVAEADQINGTVNVLPGTYENYTQWVWFDNTIEGDHQLPPPDDYASIRFVEDRGSVYQGIVEIALSPDKHEAEMVAPFRGFMRDVYDNPIMALDKTIDISFSLEASGELALGHDWASDTAMPIVGYYLSPLPGDANMDQVVDDKDASILGAHWLVSSGATWSMGDFNHDQKVDDRDAAILAAHWAPAAEAASAPEPSTIALLLGALASLLVWRRRG